MGGLEQQVSKALKCLPWLPAYGWQWLTQRPPRAGVVHLMLALADHFEPATVPGVARAYAPFEEQEQRVERWCSEYPKAVGRWRDADGRPLRHTYFYPAEQYDNALVARLAEHCQKGWGEIEIHLHHGVEAPDTAENTRRTLLELRNALAEHGCL